MKIKILFIKNKLDYSIAQDIEKYKQWLTSIGLEPQFDFKDSNLDLSFKNFLVGNMWGIDGIKQQLRESLLVPVLTYDIVFFCYNDPKFVTNLANWTYPNPLNSSAFCEIVYTPQLVGLNGDVLIHESTHAFNRILMWKGIYIVDCLDQGLDMIPFYKPYFKEMLKEYTLQKKIWFVSDMIKFLKSLLEKMFPKPKTIEELIKETADKEGISPELFKIGLAVLKCESRLDPKARYVNKDGSVDRGIAQWNSKWWPQITDEMAYNPEKALPLFWKYFKKRPQDWVCFSSGKYKKFLS